MKRFLKLLFVKLRMDYITDLFSWMEYLIYLGRVSKFIGRVNLRFDYFERYDLYGLLNEGSIDYFEFGVGESMKWWIRNNHHADSRFFGFDTFNGLPEDWGKFKIGDMKTDKLSGDRVTCIEGLFQETLQDFLKHYTKKNRIIVHLDADLYSSTLFVLTTMDSVLGKGDIVIFDEFIVPLHEFKAWTDYTKSYKRDYRLLAHRNNYYFTAFVYENSIRTQS